MNRDIWLAVYQLFQHYSLRTAYRNPFVTSLSPLASLPMGSNLLCPLTHIPTHTTYKTSVLLSGSNRNHVMEKLSFWFIMVYQEWMSSILCSCYGQWSLLRFVSNPWLCHCDTALIINKLHWSRKCRWWRARRESDRQRNDIHGVMIVISSAIAPQCKNAVCLCHIRSRYSRGNNQQPLKW
jgi:hypothetical protein